MISSLLSVVDNLRAVAVLQMGTWHHRSPAAREEDHPHLLASTGMGKTSVPSLPVGREKREMVRDMFDRIAPGYERCNAMLTFGLDRRWRASCLDMLALAAPARVLDLACGTGDLTRLLEARRMEAVGADLSFGMLRRARSRTVRRLVEGDAETLPFRDGSFDGAVSGFAMRNLSNLPASFAELARVIRPGGRIAILDVGEPTLPVVRAAHGIWFHHAVPFIGGLLSDRSAYAYLPRSVSYLPEPRVIVRMIEDAGFLAVNHSSQTFGVARFYSGTRA